MYCLSVSGERNWWQDFKGEDQVSACKKTRYFANAMQKKHVSYDAADIIRKMGC
jgi:hypothetical protein